MPSDISFKSSHSINGALSVTNFVVSHALFNDELYIASNLILFSLKKL